MKNGHKVDRLQLRRAGKNHSHPVDNESFQVYSLNGLPCVQLLRPMQERNNLRRKQSGQLIASARYTELTLLPIPIGMKRVANFNTGDEFTHPTPLVELNDTLGQESGLLFFLHRLSANRRGWEDANDIEIGDFCNLHDGFLGFMGVDSPCAYPIRASDGSNSRFVVEWDWVSATQSVSGGRRKELHYKLKEGYFSAYQDAAVKLVAATTPNRTVVWLLIPADYKGTLDELARSEERAAAGQNPDCFTIYHPVYLDGPNIWIGKFDPSPWKEAPQPTTTPAQ